MRRLEQVASNHEIRKLQLSALPLSTPFFRSVGYQIRQRNQFKDKHLRQLHYFIIEKAM